MVWVSNPIPKIKAYKKIIFLNHAVKVLRGFFALCQMVWVSVHIPKIKAYKKITFLNRVIEVLCGSLRCDPVTISHEALGHRPQPVVFGLVWLWNRNSHRSYGSKGLDLFHFTQSPPVSHTP